MAGKGLVSVLAIGTGFSVLIFWIVSPVALIVSFFVGDSFRFVVIGAYFAYQSNLYLFRVPLDESMVL